MLERYLEFKRIPATGNLVCPLEKRFLQGVHPTEKMREAYNLADRIYEANRAELEQKHLGKDVLTLVSPKDGGNEHAIYVLECQRDVIEEMMTYRRDLFTGYFSVKRHIGPGKCNCTDDIF